MTKRFHIGMVLILVVLTIWAGQGFRLEIDTRSGEMREIKTVFDMAYWRGEPEASVLSEWMQDTVSPARNWVSVGERTPHQRAWGATDCFCIWDLLTALRDRQAGSLRKHRNSTEVPSSIWKFISTACLAELEHGVTPCDLSTQTKAFLAFIDDTETEPELTEQALRTAWRKAGAFAAHRG